MCPMCDGLCETIKIKYPNQYYSIVDQIKVMLKNDTLLLTESNCDFSKIRKNEPWPGGILYHVFKCTKCDQIFSLCVDTYHGYGGSWEVMYD